MAPKLAEQWKAILMPVVLGTSLFGDGFEETEEGLMSSVRRHLDLEVPGWIIQFRLDLIEQLQEATRSFCQSLSSEWNLPS